MRRRSIVTFLALGILARAEESAARIVRSDRVTAVLPSGIRKGLPDDTSALR